jgi:hypothetical protein
MTIMVEKECLQCGGVVTVREKDIKRGRGKFCSLSCSSTYNASRRPKKEPNVSCANCGNEFYKNASDQKQSKSGLFFCNRKCKAEAQKVGGLVEIQPSHYGKNYRTICFTHHKKECVVCGEDKIVSVHHYDENHNNNDPNNLVPLCPTHHQYVHSGYKDLVIDKINDWMKGLSC